MTMSTKKEGNKVVLERLSFHLDEAMRFCNQLDLSALGPTEKSEWDSKIKICKDAIGFTRESVQKLSKILE
jgi:hypothetical protein